MTIARPVTGVCALLGGLLSASLTHAAPNVDGRTPGSVLIYPFHQTGPSELSLLSVTNTSVDPSHAGTMVHFDYVNQLPAGGGGGMAFAAGAAIEAQVKEISVGGMMRSTLERNYAAGPPTPAMTLVEEANEQLENGKFTNDLTGWMTSESGSPGTNPGSVSVVNGEACLLEGDSFRVTLQQYFLMPSSPSTIEFELSAVPGFDLTDSFIPDAFEVSLLDASLNSLVPSWDPGATSYYNLQEDGTELLGAATTLDNGTVIVDVSSIPGGTPVLLTFDLIGGDSDQASGVKVGCAMVTSSIANITCSVTDRIEYLTPADTLSVLTRCHNPVANAPGYVVVSAQNPNLFDMDWSHNFLVGSALVMNDQGGIYSVNAIPFESPLASGLPTDQDFDAQLDFDGIEYEGVPDTLYVDSFLAVPGSSLTLLNLTGGLNFTASVAFDIWNDNEAALSSTASLKCWRSQELSDWSLVFDGVFLRDNTPHDPQEFDVDCDLVGDIETGWVRINGLVASSPADAVADPAILGAISAGPTALLDGGHLLWESRTKQLNGDFFKTGTVDPED